MLALALANYVVLVGDSCVEALECSWLIAYLIFTSELSLYSVLILLSCCWSMFYEVKEVLCSPVAHNYVFTVTWTPSICFFERKQGTNIY